MASAVDSRLAYARLSAVATASRLPTATRGSNNSYTTSWDTTVSGGKFITKMYECSPGKFPVEPYFIDCYELAHILTGKLIVTDSDGNTQTYEAGDVFITPQGFTGTWEIVETMRKVFAIRHD